MDGIATHETFSCGLKLTADHIKVEASRVFRVSQVQEVRRGKIHKRCGSIGQRPQETAIGSPLKNSRVTCPACALKLQDVSICHVSCCIPQPFSTVFQDGDLLRVSECSEKQSARSSAVSRGGQCLGDKRNHVTGACHPGQTPTEAQLQPLLQPIQLNPGNTASLKRLIFESQTLVCNEVKLKANRKDDAAHTPHLPVLRETPGFNSRRTD